MAPLRATAAVDRENRNSNRELPNASKFANKDNMVTPRGNRAPLGAGEEKSHVTPRGPRGANLGPTVGVPRRTGGAVNQRGTARMPLTSRAQAAKDPWNDVKAVTTEADKLEAELAALQAKVKEAETEALEAESAAHQAEEDFTTRSATMLEEYTAQYEKNLELEAKLATAKKTLENQRADNLLLSQRSIELDREARNFQEQIKAAEELLEQCTNSQAGIDAEITEKKAICESLQTAARNQGERLATDLQRFAAMKARLLEVCDPLQTQGEAQQLLAEADLFAARTQQAQKDCEQIAHDGLVPNVALHTERPAGLHDSNLDSSVEAKTSQSSSMVMTIAATPPVPEPTEEFAGVEAY